MDPVFILQIALSAAFALAIGVWANMRHAEYVPEQGVMETILLTSFVEKNVGEQVDDSWFLTAPVVDAQGSAPELPNRPKRFITLYALFKTKGSLSKEDILPKGELENRGVIVDAGVFIVVAIILLIFSPFMFSLWLNETREKNKNYNWGRILHPLERSLILMQVIGSLLSVGALFFLAVAYTTGKLRLTLLALLLIPMSFMVYAAVRSILNQTLWKDYWADRLLAVLQMAANRNDHDLYNRAMNLLVRVESQPTIPLTPIQRVVIIIFALGQVLAPQLKQLLDVIFRPA